MTSNASVVLIKAISEYHIRCPGKREDGMSDDRTKFRRPNKVQRKYYLSPDVAERIDGEAERTGYPRGTVVDIVIRQALGTPHVVEAAAAPRRKRTTVVKMPKPKEVDLGL